MLLVELALVDNPAGVAGAGGEAAGIPRVGQCRKRERARSVQTSLTCACNASSRRASSIFIQKSAMRGNMRIIEGEGGGERQINSPALFFDFVAEEARGTASAAENGHKTIEGSRLADVVSGIAEGEARTAAGYARR